MSNPLIGVVTSCLSQFIESLDDETRALPCEVQVRGHLINQELDVTFGSGLWDGTRLMGVIALNNAFMLTRRPSRAQKYYLYGVLRARVPGVAGLRYTYILPPDDIFECDVVDEDSQDELLLLDADVQNYARNSLK